MSLVDYLGLVLTPTEDPALGDLVVRGPSGGWTTVLASGSLPGNVLMMGAGGLPTWTDTVPAGSPRVDAVQYGEVPVDGSNASPAISALMADPIAQQRGIWFPAAIYVLNSNVLISNPVDVAFAPGALFITSGGVVGNALFTMNSTHNYNVLTGYSPMNDMHVGDNTVVLTSAGDIAALGTPSGYNVGNWVILRRGETGAGPPFTPIAEINKIQSLTGTGFVLKWPMSKDITVTSTTLNGAIDNVQTSVVLTSTAGLAGNNAVQVGTEIIGFTGTTGGTTLTGVTRGAYGSTAASHSSGVSVTDIFGVKKATKVIEGVKFQDLNVDHDGTVFNGAMVYDLEFQRPKMRCRRPVSHAAIRNQRVHDPEVHLYADPNAPSSNPAIAAQDSYFWVMGATGFTDGVLENPIFESESGGYIHIHEYATGIRVKGGVSRNPPGVDQVYPVVSIAGGGRDIRVGEHSIVNAGRDAIKVQAGNSTAPEDVDLQDIKVFGTIGRACVTAQGIKRIRARDIEFRGTQTNGGTYPTFDFSNGTKMRLTELQIADDASGCVTGLALGTGSGIVGACDLNNVSGSPVTVADPGTIVWMGSRGYENPSTRRIFIPRSAFQPISGSGTPPTLVAIGGGPYGMAWAFPTGVDGMLEATFLPPVDWDQWTVTMLWGRTDLGGGVGAGAQNVRINAFVAAAGNTQSLTTFGTETDTTVAIPVQNLSQTDVIISNHNPGSSGLGVRLVVKRKGTATGVDTFTGNMLFLGAYLTKNNAYT